MNLRERLNRAGLPRTVWVLAITNFLVAIGFGVVIPVLSPFARTFGATNFQLGLVVSMFAFMRLITSPWATRISRRIGERNAITLGMVIVATTTLGVALSPNLWWMIVVRALGGIGSATFTIAAFNLMISTTPQQLRGRASGLNQGGFLLGNMAGPALGGLLGAISLQAPFYFYSVMLLVAGLVAHVLLPVRSEPLPTASKEALPFREVLRDIRYRAACLMGFAQGWQSIGVRSALVPVIITEVHAMGTSWSGIAFATAAVVQTLALPGAGMATDRMGRRPVMMTAGLLCGLATLAIPFAPNIWVLIVLLCVYGIGGAMQGTAPASAVGDASRGRGGAPVAAYSMIVDLGAIIGPLVAGAIVDHAGHGAGFAVGGVILLVGAAVAALIPKDLDRSFLTRPTT
ncbi:MFS transporter [Arachnia propionica]|uniref:MFS transporter n=1 Tax=Arachnia propionica TaxID=1750 RepID=A0A3P1WXV1_9ACTN|nr:MFS transporter [Arachnia propionica]